MDQDCIQITNTIESAKTIVLIDNTNQAGVKQNTNPKVETRIITRESDQKPLHVRKGKKIKRGPGHRSE